jgi:hypothetical protein
VLVESLRFTTWLCLRMCLCGLAPRRTLLPSIPELPMRLPDVSSTTSLLDTASCSGSCQGLQASDPETVEAASSLGGSLPSSNVHGGPQDLSTASTVCGNGDVVSSNGSMTVKTNSAQGAHGGPVVNGTLREPGLAAPATPPPSPVAPRPSFEGFNGRHGVASFRTGATTGNRSKLESFDRKIGKQPNLIQARGCSCPAALLVLLARGSDGKYLQKVYFKDDYMYCRHERIFKPLCCF